MTDKTSDKIIKKAGSAYDGFKKFAFKGNVIDMAVGVIIGGAFGKIVTSVVNDLIMPLIGVLTGGVHFSDLCYVLKEATEDKPALTLNYGVFLQTVTDFFLIALSIYTFINIISKMKEKFEKKEEVEAAKAAPEPPKPTQEELLAEIITILKTK